MDAFSSAVRSSRPSWWSWSSSWSSWLLAAIVAIVDMAVVSVVLFGLHVAERRYLFPIDEVRTHELRAQGEEGEEEVATRTFVAADGVRGHALELVARDRNARVVVDFHNNRQTVETRIEWARSLYRTGLGVLLVEYRGYGASREAGQPSEEGLYLDGEAALAMLGERGIGPDRIVLCGTSLGTGVAAEMARRGRGARLVLVSPYTSIPDLITAVVPLVPARALIPDHFDTLTKSSSIEIPTLVVHGDADEIVPFWMGEKIAGAIHGARLLRIMGGHHSDLFARDGERLLLEIAAIAQQR